MTSTIEQQFIEYIVMSIVGNPQAVSVARTVDDKGILLELTVHEDDLGRVIGKRGVTAQSLRTLLRALGTKNDERYNLKIIDVGPPPERRERDDDRRDSSEERQDRRDDRPRRDETPREEEKQAPVAEEAPAAEEVVKETQDVEEPEENTTSSAVARARAELADLDDLDI
jgi:predicted RNA-binding protein YlqC (UPF0109 family)